MKELMTFKSAAAEKKYTVWMSEITKVEMIKGKELYKQKRSDCEYISKKDQRKLQIIEEMMVRWVTYPYSKLDDEYSRLGVSFRFAGKNSDIAEKLERYLLSIEGVSDGDARQITSCVYGSDDQNLSIQPNIVWIVTEDQKLVKSLQKEVDNDRLPELSAMNIGNVARFIFNNQLY